MGYKNNQFFRIGTVGNATDRTNPQFVNTSSIVRTFENGNIKENILQRGYIRGLLEQVSSDTQTFNVTSYRCNFQFNPSTIQHNVPMRTNITNMFLQSPAQFSQPIGGEVTFAFELLFDRTHTLNEERDDATGGGAVGTETEAQIGVLADIRTLYAVIGQGISASNSEVMAQIAKLQAQAQVQLGLDYIKEQDLERASDLGFISGSNFFDKTVNEGNTAFLIPLPVRVVFSSLFMVDGYVTNTDVVYTKFSRTMVPIQCMVTLSMQAMYVGFAKEKTFLTYNLEQAALADQEQIIENIRNGKENIKNINAAVKKIKVIPRTSIKGLPRSSNFIDDSCIQYFTNLVNYGAVLEKVYSGVNRSKLSEARYIQIKVDDSDISDEQVQSIFNDFVTMTFKSNISVYGPFSKEDAEFLESFENGKITQQENMPPEDLDRANTLKRKLISTMGIHAGKGTISTFEQWKNIKKSGLDFPAWINIKQNYTVAFLESLFTQDNRYFVAINTTKIDTASRGTIRITPMFFNNSAIHFEVKTSIQHLLGQNPKFELTWYSGGGI